MSTFGYDESLFRQAEDHMDGPGDRAEVTNADGDEDGLIGLLEMQSALIEDLRAPIGDWVQRTQVAETELAAAQAEIARLQEENGALHREIGFLMSQSD